jgi:hypothetical protein
MVLNPLTEVGIRVLMPIRIGRCQFMVHVLCNGKRSNGEQQQNEAGGDAALQRP